MPPLLELRELGRHYGPVAALQKVSFEVRQGEIFGLVGPNGAGKTTLMSIVSGLLEADAGVVLFEGKPFTGSREQRRVIGLAPQELALYGELTARENLRFFGELYGLRGGPLAERVDGLLVSLGLAGNKDQRVATFSGGMQRRLNLGAALVHSPRLLLLDEPTAGVDAQSRNHIFEEVRRLKGQGVTIIYTTHYMEEVEALCSRIGILDGGRLIACDTLEGLLRLLPGRVVLRLRTPSAAFAEAARQWEGTSVTEEDAVYTLESPDVKRSLFQAAAWAGRNGVEVVEARLEEPNLQRVFLHLTGRALRD